MRICNEVLLWCSFSAIKTIFAAESGAEEFRAAAGASEHLNGFVNEDYKRWAMRIDTLCSQIKVCSLFP